MVGFFITLCKNINHFPVPNGDVFQYMYDGYQYVNFKLPSNIHPPPFVPFLICFIAKIFKQVEYPELFSAYSINFIASTLILFNIFLLLKKKSPILALVTVILLATNKIYFFTIINLTNEIVYGYFLTLALLLYQKKHYKITYLLSGLLFLIRYESLVVQLSIFIVEYFYNRKQFKIKNVLISFTPVIIWLIILNFHSSGSSIFQNVYFSEIYYGLKNIPNLNVFKSLADIIFFNPLINLTYPLFGYNKYNLFLSNNVYLILSISILFLFLSNFFKKNNNNLEKIIYLILILHLLFIAAFPQFCIRYLASVIWIIYLLIIDRNNKKIKILIIISLLFFNISQINNKSDYDVPEKFEYRYTANWLNKQTPSKPIKVLIYDPVTIKYYIHNKYITIDFQSYEGYNSTDNIYRECQDNIICVAKKINQEDLNQFDIYIVTTSYSSQPVENFPDQETVKMHHMIAFKNFPAPVEKDNYQLIETIGNQQYWAKIYKYIPPKTP